MSHRLFIKQKVFSIGRDHFSIKDGNGNDVYYAKGKFVSLHSTLTIYNRQNVEVARVEKQIVSLRPCFDIYVHGKKYAKIKKKLSLMRDKFSIELPVSNSLHATGSIWDHNFKIERNNQVIARVDKAVIAWGDSYAIDIFVPEENIDLLLIGLVLAWDTLEADDGD